MALIDCSECGKQVSDKAGSCPNCGNPISQKQEEYLCCPKCKSKELHAEKNGFNIAKAIGGAVLTGGVGLLAGTIGSKDIYLTCLKCGNKFKAGDAFVDKGLNGTSEIEDSVIALLKKGETANACKYYMDNTFPKPSMGDMTKYMQKLAIKNNLTIKK